MEKIEAEIKKIDKILEQNLLIPDYQRPYCWTAENVRLLLQDIYESWKQGKRSYRVGSIILHTENDKTFNIVDGQQRITTILLILNVLNSPAGQNLRKELKYNHIDSINGIINNRQFIELWIKESINSEKLEFSKYLTQYCEFVEIKVSDLSEAFQMFDSQNGRGKELEPYNLLKSYHIRAMETETYDTKIDCDRKWENATRFFNGSNISDILKQLFNEQLYRTRVWSRKQDAYNFHKKEIKEFKGISINKNMSVKFPYQNKELLQYIANNYFQTIGVGVTGIKNRFSNFNYETINPFVLINQNILNGKSFFEYVETYVEIYKQLFELNNKDLILPDFKEFYKTNCLGYKGAYRDGDIYLRELYKSLIFLMFDKFGEEGVNKYYKTLYARVYRLRLEKLQVKYSAVAQYPAKYELFSIIENANSFLELQQIEKLAKIEIDCKKEVKEILVFFYNFDVVVKTKDKNIDLTKYSKLNNEN